MNRFGWLLQAAIEKKLPGLSVALASSIPLHLNSPSIVRIRKDSADWGLPDRENYPLWEKKGGENDK